MKGRLKQRIEDFLVEEIPKPVEPGEEYTIFWLKKFNWETHRAVKTIAKRLHVSGKRIGFAGTKDKRAVTKQRLSAWKIEPEQLEALKIKDMKLYGFEKSAHRINLGNLEGNKFEIIIRDIDLSEEEIKKELEEKFEKLKKGILNIFGPQRFGEVRPITHLVGKEMIMGRFPSAVKMYLTKIFEKEPDDAKEARKFLGDNWNKEGFKKAILLFPKRLKYERSMLDYLYKIPTDYAGALRRLPKKLRKLFVNAVQSDIWNRSVEYGPQRKLRLPGCDTSLRDDPIEKKMKKIMEEEGIEKRHFEVRSMPELRCSGHERNLLLVPKDLKILEISDDEFNEDKKKAKISFSLPSGSYATVVLGEILD